MKSYSEHYDEEYFNWQKRVGIFGAQANKFKFTKSVNKYFVVLDFIIQYTVLRDQHIHLFPKESYFQSLSKSIYGVASRQSLS